MKALSCFVGVKFKGHLPFAFGDLCDQLPNPQSPIAMPNPCLPAEPKTIPARLNLPVEPPTITHNDLAVGESLATQVDFAA